MRPYILCMLFVVLSTTVYSQSASELDSKYGFKKFRFGMSPSQIGNLTAYSAGKSFKNVDIYKYSGGDISEIRGIRLQDITLYFYNQKLYRISVDFGSPIQLFSEIDYQIINESLIASFGRGYEIKNKYQGDMLILSSSFWDGRKVRMEYTRVNLKPDASDKYNHIVGYILFIEKNLNEQQKRDELF